jgi:hypothetical protein
MFGFMRPRSQGYDGYGNGQSVLDEYGGGYGGYGGYGGLSQRQELELRRRQQTAQAQRRRQAQQEATLRRQQAAKEHQKELLRRQQQRGQRARILQRYNEAATVIQRAFRSYRARQQEERAQSAAIVITDAVRRAAAIQQARRVTTSLRRLHETRSNLRDLRGNYERQPTGFRHNLYFVDRLEKLVISLDAVATHGSPFLRAFRKSIVTEAQSGLSFADVVAKTLRRKAVVIQRAVRHYLAHGAVERQDAAARVITRAVRAAPVVRKARVEADVMQKLRSKRRRLNTLHKEYTKALKTLVGELEGLHAHGDLGKMLHEEASREARATLAALVAARGSSVSVPKEQVV